jgi:hypothetical protein
VRLCAFASRRFVQPQDPSTRDPPSRPNIPRITFPPHPHLHGQIHCPRVPTPTPNKHTHTHTSNDPLPEGLLRLIPNDRGMGKGSCEVCGGVGLSQWGNPLTAQTARARRRAPIHADTQEFRARARASNQRGVCRKALLEFASRLQSRPATAGVCLGWMKDLGGY